MKPMVKVAGKIEPKVLLLAAVLGLALLGVGLSWRMNQTPASVGEGAEPAPALDSVAQLSRDADRLADVVEERLQEDSKSIAADWPEVEVPTVVARAVVKESAMTFRLRGVVRGGNQPMAFLDDRTVAVGEEIDGFKLVDIADDHVTLQDSKGKRHQLYPESGP